MQTHIRVLCHDGSSWLLRALTSCSTYIFLLLLLVSQSLLSCFVPFRFISCAKCTRDVRIFIRVKFISVWHPKFCQKEIRPRYVLIGNCTQHKLFYFLFASRQSRDIYFSIRFVLLFRSRCRGRIRADHVRVVRWFVTKIYNYTHGRDRLRVPWRSFPPITVVCGCRVFIHNLILHYSLNFLLRFAHNHAVVRLSYKCVQAMARMEITSVDDTSDAKKCLNTKLNVERERKRESGRDWKEVRVNVLHFIVAKVVVVVISSSGQSEQWALGNAIVARKL